MPLINGFDFLDRYKELSKTVRDRAKVMVLTTSRHIKDREKALIHPQLYGYLLKPVRHEHLKAIIDDFSLLESH